jgi:hypothetical protein
MDFKNVEDLRNGFGHIIEAVQAPQAMKIVQRLSQRTFLLKVQLLPQDLNRHSNK